MSPQALSARNVTPSDLGEVSPDPGEVSPEVSYHFPELYRKITAVEWTRMDPWRFLRGDAFSVLHRDLNAWLEQVSVRAPGGLEARLVLPFATCRETRRIACLQVIPKSPRVLVVQGGGAPEVVEIAPSFQAWFQTAIDDVIRAAIDNTVARMGPRPELPMEEWIVLGEEDE